MLQNLVTHPPHSTADGKPPQCIQTAQVRAWGVVRANYLDIEKLRKTTGLPGVVDVEPNFFKNADEQTIVGFEAILTTIRNFQMEGEDFGQWSLFAAPCLLGRVESAAWFNEHTAGKNTRRSLFLIPQRSLHSLSGTLSVALGTHGPNFGIDGGPDATRQGLMSAFSMFDPAWQPGAFIVLTGWDIEPTPFPDGTVISQGHCIAIVLALDASNKNPSSLTLEYHVPVNTPKLTPEQQSATGVRQTPPSQLTVSALADFLTALETKTNSELSLKLDWGAKLKIVAAEKNPVPA